MSAITREQIETVRAMEQRNLDRVRQYRGAATERRSAGDEKAEAYFIDLSRKAEAESDAIAALLRVVEKVGETELRVKAAPRLSHNVAEWWCEECGARGVEERTLAHKADCLEPDRRALRRALAAHGGEKQKA